MSRARRSSRHRGARRASGAARARGFTLVEVLVASTVVGVVLVGGSWAMSAASKASTVLANESLTASLLAREIHSLALSLDKTPSGSTGATSGADVLALDSLIGASFSPPLRADAAADASLAGWTQLVDLEIYDLADLTAPALDDPALGLDPDAARLYRLRVDVLAGGELVHSSSWWMAP